MKLRPWTVDVVLAGACFALAQLEVWTADLGEDPRGGLALMGAAISLPLLVRRRWPLAVLLWVAAVLFVGGIVWPSTNDAIFPGSALLAAIYAAGRYCEPRQAVVAGVVGLGSIVAGTANEDWDGLANFLGNVLFLSLALGAPFVAGRAIRARQQRLVEVETGSEERARAAAAEERMRIARELHDVVGHALSVIVVQAGVERKLLGDDGGQASTREALDAIECTGRDALTEMRRLVGMLREGEDRIALAPQPSLREIDRLVEEVRRAGLAVDLQTEGEPVDLPPGVDLSAFRIVQEALTNAVKHAGPASVRVGIRYAPDELALTIDDDGRAARGAPAGRGHGLIGMHERVSVLGGSMEAGQRDGGGYAVRVRLPL